MGASAKAYILLGAGVGDDLPGFETFSHFQFPRGCSGKEIRDRDGPQRNSRVGCVVFPHNVSVFSPFLVQPEVTVYLERPPVLGHPSVLLWSATGFYPGDIRIRWSRNGQEERGGHVHWPYQE